MNRAVILVDVQNIYYTTRQAYAASFDYNRLWREMGLIWRRMGILAEQSGNIYVINGKMFRSGRK